MSYKIEVIFKRSVADVVRNLFRSKAKRFPRVAVFEVENRNNFVITDGGLRVEFGDTAYVSPMHKIERIKAS